MPNKINMPNSFSKTIAHLPYNHGSLATHFAAAETNLGAKTIVFAPNNKFSHYSDKTLINPARISLSSLRAFLDVWQVDVIIFNYGSSLFDPAWRQHFLLDLPFYRKKQKKAMVFQGSDIRIKYNGIIKESREVEKAMGNVILPGSAGGLITNAEVERKIAKAKKASRFVDKMFFLNPDLSKALPDKAQFLPYPFNLSAIKNTPIVPPENRVVKVVHLATNRVLKGTGLIEKALSEAGKNVKIDTRILVRVDKKQAMEAFEWADLVIDQMCLGWYGIQALEALALGKPVLCWLEKTALQKHLPQYNDKPFGIINTHYKHLARIVTYIAENPQEYYKQANAGKQFLMDVHNADLVVRQAYGEWLI